MKIERQRKRQKNKAKIESEKQADRGERESERHGERERGRQKIDKSQCALKGSGQWPPGTQVDKELKVDRELKLMGT